MGFPRRKGRKSKSPRGSSPTPWVMAKNRRVREEQQAVVAAAAMADPDEESEECDRSWLDRAGTEVGGLPITRGPPVQEPEKVLKAFKEYHVGALSINTHAMARAQQQLGQFGIDVAESMASTREFQVTQANTAQRRVEQSRTAVQALKEARDARPDAFAEVVTSQKL